MATPEQNNPSFYLFDDVVVDCENFRVLKKGETRTLEPRAFNLLLFLVQNPGRVLEKQVLFENIWKDAFVTDNALTRAIKEIRRAIGDDANAPRYIETLPKRGYRFIAEVRTHASQVSETIPQVAEAEATQITARTPEAVAAAFNYKVIKKLGQAAAGLSISARIHVCSAWWC